MPTLLQSYLTLTITSGMVRRRCEPEDHMHKLRVSRMSDLLIERTLFIFTMQQTAMLCRPTYPARCELATTTQPNSTTMRLVCRGEVHASNLTFDHAKYDFHKTPSRSSNCSEVKYYAI